MTTQPPALANLRAEHDTVFGCDPSCAAAQLKETPTLLDQCHYTLAFVEETPRIYLAASYQRLGTPDICSSMLSGQRFPTKGLKVIIVHQAIHWNPRLGAKPREFIPERWLVKPGHELYPPEGAFKALDVGPRRCMLKGKPGHLVTCPLWALYIYS